MQLLCHACGKKILCTKQAACRCDAMQVAAAAAAAKKKIRTASKQTKLFVQPVKMIFAVFLEVYNLEATIQHSATPLASLLL